MSLMSSFVCVCFFGVSAGGRQEIPSFGSEFPYVSPELPVEVIGHLFQKSRGVYWLNPSSSSTPTPFLFSLLPGNFHHRPISTGMLLPRFPPVLCRICISSARGFFSSNPFLPWMLVTPSISNLGRTCTSFNLEHLGGVC